MKGPGGRFERQVLASVPRWAWARKAADPPARPFKCRCGGDIAPRCSRCGSQHDHPATFTRRNSWDIEIRWKNERVPDWPKDLRHSPERYHRHELLIECKSTDGKPLPFAKVVSDELSKAADYGAFGGVLWEHRGAESVVHYIPIGLWLELEATIGMKSLPLAVAAGRGLRVAVDPDRGKIHTYYKIDELLRTLAGVPAAPKPAQLALI